MLDIVIKGGTLVDGTGSQRRTADVGVQDGTIVELGHVSTPARRVIEAEGLAVTPGFIDLHTHYDGQALWDDELNPSFSNGVTTAFLGNCGVGFAPIQDGMQDRLIDLMDGVEEIPGSVLSEGLDWNWRSFPEYLDRLEAKARTINIGALMTHGPLRLFVMGDKVERRAPAGGDEIHDMELLVDEAMRAGAWGLSSSRTPVHTSASGEMTPDFDVDFIELRALGEVVGRYRGIFGFAPLGNVGEDFAGLMQDMRFYETLATETGAAVHLLVSQTGAYPDYWREQLGAMDRVAARGGRMYGQVNGRGIGVMFGLLNTNPFETRPSYLDVRRLPQEQQMAAFRDPSVRARILAETDNWQPRRAWTGTMLDSAYAFTDLDYEPGPDRKLTNIAARSGSPIEAVAYDLMIRDGFIFIPALNYHDGDLAATYDMINHPCCLLAASDAGAHSLTVCDGALPTFMLTHWVRDRSRGPRLGLESIVRLMTSKPAEAVGLDDRGKVRVGMKADLNVIDLDALRMKPPQLVRDLPAGGTRLLQNSSGYRATVVNGRVTREYDEDCRERPGVLLRRMVA